MKIKYLDLVELIKEKPTYTKAGVKVGDFGAVMSEKPINGKWQVIFSEFYTGKDIADIMVAEEDLKVHESIPKDRYPKKILTAIDSKCTNFREFTKELDR